MSDFLWAVAGLAAFWALILVVAYRRGTSSSSAVTGGQEVKESDGQE